MACNAPAQRTASALFCAPARSWQRVLHAPYSSPPQALDACPRCASNWLRVELQPTPFSRPCYCSYMFEMNRDKETTPAIDVSPAAMKQLKARAPVPSKAEKEEKELDWLAPWTAHQEAGEACRQRLLAMPREAWPPRPPPDRPENVAHGYAYRTHTGRLLQIIAPLLSGSSPPTWKCIYKGSYQVELVEHRSYSLR